MTMMTMTMTKMRCARQTGRATGRTATAHPVSQVPHRGRPALATRATCNPRSASGSGAVAPRAPTVAPGGASATTTHQPLQAQEAPTPPATWPAQTCTRCEKRTFATRRGGCSSSAFNRILVVVVRGVVVSWCRSLCALKTKRARTLSNLMTALAAASSRRRGSRRSKCTWFHTFPWCGDRLTVT